MRTHGDSRYFALLKNQLLLAIGISIAGFQVSFAAEAAPTPEAAVRASAQEFVDAFNRRDAQAIAKMWAPKGTLSENGGPTLEGPAAIEAEYRKFFKTNPQAKMKVSVEKIAFPTPTLAIEDGVSQVQLESESHPRMSRYTAIHALDKKQWQLVSVRETSLALPTQAARLSALDWLVGKWAAKHEGVEVHSEFRWIANQSFLERSYRVDHNGIATSSGKQIIGYDPQSGKIRSWSFDSSGSYGAGLWTATPSGWEIASRGVLPDGTLTSSLDHFIRVPGENDVFGWRSTHRKAGAVALPATREIVLDRVPTSK